MLWSTGNSVSANLEKRIICVPTYYVIDIILLIKLQNWFNMVLIFFFIAGRSFFDACLMCCKLLCPLFSTE